MFSPSEMPKGSKKLARDKSAKQTPPLDQRKHPSRSRSHPGGMQEAENGSSFTPDSRALLAYLRHATWENDGFEAFQGRRLLRSLAPGYPL